MRSALDPPAGVRAYGPTARRLVLLKTFYGSSARTGSSTAAAATDLDKLETDPDRADRVNRRLPALLAAGARSSGGRLVHVSTDLVFDGLLRCRIERTTSRLRLMCTGEANGWRVGGANRDPEAIVVRTTIYGWNTVSKMSLAEWFLDRLEAGKEAPGFVDAWFTPINTAHLAEAILALLARGAPGTLLHLAGSECITKYEFGLRIARTFECDPRLVHRARLTDHRFIARRTGRACLDSSRAAAFLAAPMPSVDAGLARFRDDRAGGRRAELRRMGGNA